MYRVSYSLVTDCDVAIPVEPVTDDFFGAWGEQTSVEVLRGGDGYGRWGVDGRYYSKYGLGWSLAAAPLCALGRLLAPLLSEFTEGFVTRATVMLLNPFLTALTGILLFRLASRWYSRSTAAFLALLYGFGTIAWYYAKSAFGEPLVTLLLLAAICAIQSEHFGVFGIAIAGMILTRQTSIVLAIPLTAWGALRAREKDEHPWLMRLAKFSLPALLGQLIAMGYNFYRFGHPLEHGYGRVVWDTPLFLGLYSQLLSPGKGVFVFMPVLLVGASGWPLLLRRERNWALLILALVLSYLVPNALYRDWAGGGGWGPRLLLPIAPLILLPAGEMIGRWRSQRVGQIFLALLTAVSIFIQVLGVSVNWARHLQRVFNQSRTPTEYFHRVHYRWADSPIPGQVRSLYEVSGLLADRRSRATISTSIDPSLESKLTDWQSNAVGLLSLNVPDLWFVYLWFLDVPSSWLIGVAFLLSTLAIVATLRVREVLGRAVGVNR